MTTKKKILHVVVWLINNSVCWSLTVVALCFHQNWALNIIEFMLPVSIILGIVILNTINKDYLVISTLLLDT